MKRILAALVAAIMALTLVSCNQSTSSSTSQSGGSASDGEVRELRVLTYGGSYDDSIKENLPAFEEEYNCKVTFVNATGADTLVKIRNKEVDVVFGELLYSARGNRDGLFAEINETNVPNYANVYDIAKRMDNTVIHDISAYGIAYNPDLVSSVPDSWDDLWDPQYAGKVITRGFRADSIELMVWKAKQLGGDERNIDAGFAAMGELAKNLYAFSSEHSETMTLFQSGSVALGVWTDGRVNWAKEQDTPVEFSLPKEGGFCMISTLNVVKDSPVLDLAYAYVNMELGVEAQVNLAEDMGYFPLNKDAYDQLSDEVKNVLAFNPETIEQAQMADWSYIETVYDEWSERWEKEVTSQAN